ncbi:MAG: hypothetical protein ABWY50_04010 [Aeromicrobium sp.]
MRRTALSALAIAMLFALCACGGSSSPEAKEKQAAPAPKAFEAGQCIGGEISDGKDVAPDPETVVPCTEPHTYEIVAAIDIPDEFLAGKTDEEKLARRAQLADIKADPKGSIRAKMSAATFPKCKLPYLAATGMARLKVQGKSAAKVSMVPWVENVSQWYTVSSPEQWVAGITQAVCAYRFADVKQGVKGRAAVTPITSPTAKPVMASFLTKEFPVKLRPCFKVGGKVDVPCAKRHGQELLWSLDLKAVYGRGFLSGANMDQLGGEDFVKVQSACRDPFEQLGHGTGVGVSHGYRYFNEQGTKGTFLSAICVLNAQDTNQMGPGFDAF